MNNRIQIFNKKQKCLELFRVSISIFLFSFFFSTASAQTKILLQPRFISADSVLLKQKFSAAKFYDSQQAIDKGLQTLLNQLNALGYLEASFDSSKISNNIFTAYITTGQIYKWATLKISTADLQWIKATGIKNVDFNNRVFNPKQLTQLKEQIIQYAENNGYPFAAVKLDSVEIAPQSLSAILKIEKNKLTKIDSIVQKGNAVVSEKYLYRYLGIKPNMLYDESAVKRITPLLKSLSFASEQQPATVIFLQEHALINLQLIPKKANRFNFLLGLLPQNNATATTKSSVLLSGEGDMHLENIQNTANQLSMNFKLYPNQTKQLHLDYLHPYPLGIPFGIDGALDINKYDSTYLDVAYQVGVLQLMKGNDYVKIFYKNISSSLTFVDTNLVKATHQLPGQIDAASRLGGVEAKIQRLDYKYNPSRGYEYKINLSAGVRQIFTNNLITHLTDANDSTFQFSSLYDTIPKQKVVGHLQASAAYYFPLKKRLVVKMGWTASKKIGSLFFNNEVERIGGFKILRGFDELAIATTTYSLQTVELRYLLGTNSFAYLFGDYAYTELFTFKQHVTDHPYGFGAGMAFETKAGIFELNYALGARDNSTVQLKSAKIHFGYLIQF